MTQTYDPNAYHQNVWSRNVDANGTAIDNKTQGDVASGATDSGNPVKVAGKYNAAAIALSDGQRGDMQLDKTGGVRISQPTIINVTGTVLTRPANTTAYSANDSISDNATAGSVTALVATLADLNDAPIQIEEILLDTSDTGPGTASAQIRVWLYNSDPTANSGVGGGDNAAFSNKRAGFIGTFSGTMRAFSDGSAGVLVPDEGSIRIMNPGSGAKTIWYQYQTLTAFTPSANSTTFTPKFKGWQGRATN